MNHIHELLNKINIEVDNATRNTQYFVDGNKKAIPKEKNGFRNIKILSQELRIQFLELKKEG